MPKLCKHILFFSEKIMLIPWYIVSNTDNGYGIDVLRYIVSNIDNGYDIDGRKHFTILAVPFDNGYDIDVLPWNNGY